jgi:glycosyltransferase involved in cell wall biosynthesis
MQVNRAAGGPIRLVAYTDALEFAGAERGLATVLGSLRPNIEVGVLGVCGEVVEAIASSRAGADARVVAPVRNKLDLAGIREHTRAVRELAPDIFQVNLRTSWSCQYGILAALRYGQTRLVASERAPIDGATAFQLWSKRRLAPRFAAHVAASEFSARRVEAQAALAPGTVHVIPNGVADDAPPLQRPTNKASGLIAGLGRLSAEKGFDIVVRALPALPEVTLHLVGDGPERHTLESLADAHGVRQRVVFAGWQTDFRERLGDFDLVVAPSRFEAFGIAIVEAMLAERAVVASRTGGIPEVVVEGETALLVPPDDPVALAEAIRNLLGDDELRERMGQRGRAHALERFSPDLAARAFEALYDQILA